MGQGAIRGSTRPRRRNESPPHNLRREAPARCRYHWGERVGRTDKEALPPWSTRQETSTRRPRRARMRPIRAVSWQASSHVRRDVVGGLTSAAIRTWIGRRGERTEDRAPVGSAREGDACVTSLAVVRSIADVVRGSDPGLQTTGFFHHRRWVAGVAFGAGIVERGADVGEQAAHDFVVTEVLTDDTDTVRTAWVVGRGATHGRAPAVDAAQRCVAFGDTGADRTDAACSEGRLTRSREVRAEAHGHARLPTRTVLAIEIAGTDGHVGVTAPLTHGSGLRVGDEPGMRLTPQPDEADGGPPDETHDRPEAEGRRVHVAVRGS